MTHIHETRFHPPYDGEIASVVCAEKSISFSAIFCGALAAVSASIVLSFVGSGLGLAFMSPWAGGEMSLEKFTVKMAIWMVVLQWISAAFGGYMAGRLRPKLDSIRTHESFFRDTAHGFLAWAVATIFVAVLVTGTAASLGAAGAKAGAAVTAGAAAGMASAAANNAQANQANNGGMPDLAYPVDRLFRSLSGDQTPQEVRAEAAGIFMRGLTTEGISPEDHAYLVQIVAREANLSPAEAQIRVDATLLDLTALRNTALDKAEKARKAASAFSFFTAISLVIGAFIAAVSACCGGCLRRDAVYERTPA